MDGKNLLVEVLRRLREHRLEAILIGNSAAAMHGAPVTTIDFDFLFRKTSGNIRKLKAVASGLTAIILRPFYPASDLFRVMREDGLQVDFMATMHGIESFERLRSRCISIQIAEETVLVAALSDVILSKRKAARPQDLAVLHVLQKTLERQKAADGAGQAAAHTRGAKKRNGARADRSD